MAPQLLVGNGLPSDPVLELVIFTHKTGCPANNGSITAHFSASPEYLMAKSTATYWNTLSFETQNRWVSVNGLEGMAEELTLSIDNESGEYTKLTRFHPGADTTPFGGKTHCYPEEVFIVSGRLYDAAFDMWLETGHYASRPPGELHGPFKSDVGCVVLEISFPNRMD